MFLELTRKCSLFGGTLPKTITLPNSEEMLRRLESVYQDSKAREQFYSLLLEDAGCPLTGEGVGVMLMMAYYKLKKATSPYHGGIGLYFPNFIDSLIDDPEVRNDAHTYVKQVFPAIYKDKTE